MGELQPGEVTVEVGGLQVVGPVGSQMRVETAVSTGSRLRPDVLAAVGLTEVAVVSLEVELPPPDGRAARGRGPGDARSEPVTVTVPPALDEGQVLLVEDGGALRWVFPDPAAGRARSRGRAPEPSRSFTVTIDQPPAATERGLVGTITKRVLRALTFRLVDDAAGQVADFFVRRWEERHRPTRLRTFTSDDFAHPNGRVLAGDDLKVLCGGPALLLVHGTNALTHTGFAGLPSAFVDELHERYAGRVAAFDHPTLSVDPVANASRLLELLANAGDLEVDLLTHSRGGLVARVLAERPDELGSDAPPLKVRQVVFVGTPNEGTPLADPAHLGTFVDGMTNLLDAIPDNPASPVIDAFSGIVAVVKQLAVGALEGLDGLTSMRPPTRGADTFLGRLNRPREVTARYRAVSADYEPLSGSGPGRRARDSVVDRLFRDQPNDLIVPTRAVYHWNGARGFPIVERLVLPSRRGIDHSSFWMATEVTDVLTRWLTAAALPPARVAARQATERGVEPDPLGDIDERLAAGDLAGVRAAIEALPEEHRRALEEEVGKLAVERFARSADAGTNHGRVVVLNGIMGSLLSAVGADGDEDRVWINPLRLVVGDFGRLQHPAAETIEVVGLHRTYLPLVIALDAEWEVVPFGFDWRLGLDVAAAELAERLTAMPGPAHLVAHSMGGLVARMLRVRHRAVWDGLADGAGLRRGGRLVMLGTPTLGSLSIATALTAEDRMVRWLSKLDLRHGIDEIQQIVASFPGVYQLLPSHDQEGPLSRAAAWRPEQVRGDLLDESRRIGRQLAADGLDPERMLYVAGSGHRTASQVFVDEPGRFRFAVTGEGDGRVTHRSGLACDAAGKPRLTKAWYSTADHGGLVKDPVVAAAVSELLRTGRTDLLPAAAPTGRRGATAVDEIVAGDELEPVPPVDADPWPATARGGAVTRSDDARVARDLAVEATRGWLGSPPAEPPPLAPLSVHVLHASLEHAAHPVVVGHYAGTPIGGAEGWADRLLRGRLSARQVFGRYPSEPSDVLRAASDVVREPGRMQGVIVVGLGDMGELTPTKLTRAMRNAAMESALAGAPPGSGAEASSDVTLGLSAVLVGSYGPDALPIPTVVAALVEGVLVANRELAETDTGRTVTIDALEFVELYGQRAEEAARAVRDLDRYLPEAARWGSTVRGAELLRVGEGGRRSAPSGDYATGMWRRLIVTMAGDQVTGDAVQVDEVPDERVTLTFTSLGVRARADLRSHVVDNRLLGRMVKGAVGAARVDSAVNVALFELLLPNELKSELATIENLVLVVDEHTAGIPWEALADRASVGGVEPLVRRMGLVRQLQLPERRDGAGPAVRPRAFVVGDPPIGPLFPRLVGAQREGESVARQLGDAGLGVEAMLFGPDATYDAGAAGSLIGRLLADDYQIVHIAAHGWYQPATNGGGSWGGVVIGPNQYLTALEIGQMRRPPDLVFLNCCHLGTIDATVPGASSARPSADDPTASDLAFQHVHRPQLAASLSRTLMAMGVRAVVAAGWAVDDGAAAAFATTFYGRLLDGDPFGNAVRAARVAAHERDRGASNTWAAYQCYGDPGFRISTAPRSRPVVSRPVSAEEVVRIVDALAIRAGDAVVDLDVVRSRLRQLEVIADEQWGTRGDLTASFGRAYSECHDFPEAVGCYRRALEATAGDVPIRVLEQLVNLETRLVDECGEGTIVVGGVPTTSQQLLESALRRVEVLDRLPPTAERRAIRAGLWKAQAVRAAGADRRRALKAAARLYFEVWELGNRSYGANNALQLDGTGGLLTKGQRTQLLAAIGSPDLLGSGGDFWGRVAAADLALTTALVDGSITTPPVAEQLLAAYALAFAERSTARERSTPPRHIAQLATLARTPAVRTALATLADRLRDWTAS